MSCCFKEEFWWKVAYSKLTNPITSPITVLDFKKYQKALFHGLRISIFYTKSTADYRPHTTSKIPTKTKPVSRIKKAKFWLGKLIDIWRNDRSCARA